jgi:acetyl/propionyl-CoA carboxylase alpha subunit
VAEVKKIQVNTEDKNYRFELRQSDGNLYIRQNGSEHKADLIRLGNNRYSLIIGGRSHEIGVQHLSDGYIVSEGSRTGNFRVEDYELARLKKAAGIDDSQKVKKVLAPMPGLIVSIRCAPGDDVTKGAPLLVMEAMKMENDIKSPLTGKIKAVHVEPRQSVDKGLVMVEFE